MSEEQFSILMHRIAAQHVREHEIRFMHQGFALGFAGMVLGVLIMAVARGV